MKQLDFTFRQAPARQARLSNPIYSAALREQFSLRLAECLAHPFRILFTDNRSTVLSVGEKHGVLVIRLHHMFIEAGDGVVRALADYVRPGRRSPRRKRAGQILDRFIEHNRHRIRSGKPPRARLSLGRVYDLSNIRDALARHYFGHAVDIPVVWAVARRLKRQRSVRLGSYSFDDAMIRIHPALDSMRVPPFVVVGVVYHEMLHHELGAEVQQGRRRVHTPAFKRREREYLFHARAEAWEQEHLHRILSAWNRGKS